MEWNYPDVGATRGDLFPAGYRPLRARARIGQGRQVFAAAARALRTFDMQRVAGLRVRPARPPARIGAEVAWGFGVAGVRLWAPCRLVWVVDEPDRYGYAYGTLVGHPEAGEESFLVWRDAGDAVWFEVRTFSRPDRWYSRLGGPLTGLVQDMVTSRYRAALTRLARTNASG